MNRQELAEVLRATPAIAEINASMEALLADPSDANMQVAQEVNHRLQAALDAIPEVVGELAAEPVDVDAQMMFVADQSARIIELATGYRQKLLAAGFSEASAEAGAMVFHQTIWISGAHASHR